MPILILSIVFNSSGFLDLNIPKQEPEEIILEAEMDQELVDVTEQIRFIKDNIASMSEIDTDFLCRSYQFREELLRFAERKTFIEYLKFKGEPESKINRPQRKEIQEVIFNMCKDTGMDYLFFLAIAKTESSFRPDAQHGNTTGSAVGSVDQGIFQINSKYELSYTRDYVEGGYDIYGWYDNVFIAIEDFKKTFKKYGDYQAMAYAWNRGKSRVYDMDYDDYKYVKTVFKYYDELYENYIDKYLDYTKE